MSRETVLSECESRGYAFEEWKNVKMNSHAKKSAEFSPDFVIVLCENMRNSHSVNFGYSEQNGGFHPDVPL